MSDQPYSVEFTNNVMQGCTGGCTKDYLLSDTVCARQPYVNGLQLWKDNSDGRLGDQLWDSSQTGQTSSDKSLGDKGVVRIK